MEKNAESSCHKKNQEAILHGPVFKTLAKLTLPIFTGMIFQLLYAIVDMIWISRIDLTDPSYVGGVGLIFPLLFLAVAFSSGMLIGVGSLVARSIGEKNQDVLNRTAESGFFIAGSISIVIVVAGYLFDKEIIFFLGGRGDYYLHALEYFRYIIPAAALMITGNVILGLLQGEGLMEKVMVAMIISTIANVSLDPVFIFLMGLGVRGAGIATVLSQIIAGFYLIRIFISKRTLVRIEWRFKNIDFGIMKMIVSVGFPQIAGQITMAAGYLFFNKIVIKIDPLALTAFSLCGRIDQVLIIPVLAIGSSLITMIGQNYGRRNYSRVIEIWRTGIITGAFITSFLSALLILFAPELFRFFTEVDTVARYAVRQIRIVELSFIVASSAILGRASFQAMGFPLPGLLITAIQLALVPIPMAYFYVYILRLGILGVWLGIITGNLSAGILGIIWVRSKLMELGRGNPERIPLSSKGYIIK
ncbi:MAG: MATE family efflux transporter [Spirochaetota bacterium]